jgi:hypothetical protein
MRTRKEGRRWDVQREPPRPLGNSSSFRPPETYPAPDKVAERPSRSRTEKGSTRFGSAGRHASARDDRRARTAPSATPGDVAAEAERCGRLAVRAPVRIAAAGCSGSLLSQLRTRTGRMWRRRQACDATAS